MATKKKKLTASEKKFRRDYKKRLVKEGVLPPPKKPLNRKAFCQEVHAAAKEHGLSIYRLREALSYIMPPEKSAFPITPEEVGVLKLVMIAIEIDRFWKAKEAEGVTQATLEEIYKHVKPILQR